MHCKDVSVRDVDIGLTKENIDLLMKDWKAYKRAEFIVLKNGDDYATLHIEKDDSKDLFSKVSGMRSFPYRRGLIMWRILRSTFSICLPWHRYRMLIRIRLLL